MDLGNPLVQAKLLVNERLKDVKQLPKMSYRDMEGLVKTLAGPQGCAHVIVNVGLSDGTWESVEAILCDGHIVSSTTDLESYSPSSEVERIITEVYAFDKSLLDELERLSRIEIPKEVVASISKTYEQPPVVKTVEALAIPKYPTDLLPRVEGDLGELKDISHTAVSYLESEGIEKYSVLSLNDAEKGKSVLVVLGPEYVSKMGTVITNLSEILREYDVSNIVVRCGMKMIKRTIR